MQHSAPPAASAADAADQPLARSAPWEEWYTCCVCATTADGSAASQPTMVSHVQPCPALLSTLTRAVARSATGSLTEQGAVWSGMQLPRQVSRDVGRRQGVLVPLRCTLSSAGSCASAQRACWFWGQRFNWQGPAAAGVHQKAAGGLQRAAGVRRSMAGRRLKLQTGRPAAPSRQTGHPGVRAPHLSSPRRDDGT